MTVTDKQVDISLSYIAAGGNRHPSAADWSQDSNNSGLLAFGSGNNVALWRPGDGRQNGVFALLAGHTDHVNTIKLLNIAGAPAIVSGASDKTIRIWMLRNEVGVSGYYRQWQQRWCLDDAHGGSINTIAVDDAASMFVSGAADGTVKVWHTSLEDQPRCAQRIHLKPKYLPLATAFTSRNDGTCILAVAGTSSSVQLFGRNEENGELELHATLTGHEGWIRALDFVDDGSDILLASGSQDKYIRLWRFSKGATNLSAEANGSIDTGIAVGKKSLSNKARHVGHGASRYNVTFEALLIGHEDWIYTARWSPSAQRPTLLSASADNSLSIWQADEASGIWVCNARLGEISAQKGSTTATGSTGGFWIGLWAPEGDSVVSLGRTGSWRRWVFDPEIDSWQQAVGIGGHVKEVRNLAWAPDGSYLISTSADQTTRLFAEWKKDETISWHEFSRPQIHGYDLNCIDALGPNQFISGADEKLLRVFDKPKAIDNLLSKLSGTETTVEGEADAANIPVLGLSNKAISATRDDEATDETMNGDIDDREAPNPASVIHKSILELDHPPLEDHLARHTLWPEHEKLYGHGYEISAVAASHDGSLVATACKASSIDHAVLRLYETSSWREVKPSLSAHTLTVTSLAFSGDDRYLLSVGRDRQWALFGRDVDDQKVYKPLIANPKGHSRMILDCSWAPIAVGHVFATAGRDKSAKIWRLDNGKAENVASISAPLPVTAVAFASRISADGSTVLALGREDGALSLARIDGETLQVVETVVLEAALCPSTTVNRIAWRPRVEAAQMAVASDDGSVRIYNVPG
ncbi:elongator complex protein 2-like [Teratosphaeria destructans]|uniref:Elongator complex protein 2 n=1 Tax=Teratosphaeria destructans TaxID=418781 RepID=A0A9W7W3S1_9PEZI|nr:elongator complex protein 2-like [Teratosphaeria destructans]